MKRKQSRPATIGFKQKADGSWESYRLAVAPSEKRPSVNIESEKGNVIADAGKAVARACKAGASLTWGAIKRLNKSALEALARKNSVDINDAKNNTERAERVYEVIEAKRKADEN